MTWELHVAEVTRQQGGTNPSLNELGQELLKQGWEPFSVTSVSVYCPEPADPANKMDVFIERVWFRREK